MRVGSRERICVSATGGNIFIGFLLILLRVGSDGLHGLHLLELHICDSLCFHHTYAAARVCECVRNKQSGISFTMNDFHCTRKLN